ncbi:hypothetical protein WMY93_033436 [Mugilogobius chulae]|uniref:Uncharacterized protein n=1 Tax=Mugilogobius chulae TaxID=88201 RepID=A0AAW0ML94_9GOBI
MTSEFQFFPLSDSSLVLDIRASASDVRDFVRRTGPGPGPVQPGPEGAQLLPHQSRSVVSDRDLQLFRFYASVKDSEENRL